MPIYNKRLYIKSEMASGFFRNNASRMLHKRLRMRKSGDMIRDEVRIQYLFFLCLIFTRTFSSLQ